MVAPKEQRPSRISEMQVGNTMFTVISVESDRAIERLYDKVKRMILSNESPADPDMKTVA